MSFFHGKGDLKIWVYLNERALRGLKLGFIYEGILKILSLLEQVVYLFRKVDIFLIIIFYNVPLDNYSL